MTAKKTIIGQVGLGRWGKNLFRNYFSLPDCRIKYACDSSAGQLKKYSNEYADVSFVDDFRVIINDPEVEAVVVATPAPLHFQIAKECLEKGKHVFVEKPITLEVGEAVQLAKLAKQNRKRLMVGHLLLYHPAVIELKRLIEKGELGDIYYIYTQRLNLGTIRSTENVVWSLAPHDLSVILHLMQKSPQRLSALGSSFVRAGIEDVAFLNLRFASGEVGHVHVSWLDPAKTRKTIVVGSKKMAVFDEIAGRNNLTLYDKGVDLKPDFKSYGEFLSLRFGEGQTLKISAEEPLLRECRHFIDCARDDKEPLSNGENGVAVLRLLAAAERSLRNGGECELL
ncbi:MAG: Gfo/Idh/MocA family oxidoreductase [Candidatus Margulisiibacteriota bacterium]